MEPNQGTFSCRHSLEPPTYDTLRPMTVEYLDLPPAAAIRHFRAKGAHIGFDWRDTAAEAHVTSFTAAKAMRLDVLRALNQGINRAQADGTTFNQFVSELKPELQRLGWWGKQDIVDPDTGELVQIDIGPRRLRTIFETNLRTSAAAGRWQGIEAAKAERPYLQYIATLDNRTRDDHRAWHDIILPVDHLYWETHYPPNGWGCRCTVLQWSEEDLAEQGLKVSDDPAISVREWMNKRTGNVHQVPVGIDPGWDHNVGKINRRVQLRQTLIDKVQSWPEMAPAALTSRARDFEVDAFRDFIAHARAGFRTYWPIAAILPARAKQLGFADKHPQIVELTPDTVSTRNHRKRFTGFTPQDWARVQTIIDEGEWVVQANHRVLWFSESGKHWKLVVKRTTAGEIMLATYHRAKDKEIRKLRKSAEGGSVGSGGA